MNALRYLTREYGISDENGNNYFLDYFIRTQNERYAVEENGLNFHHPQIIGEEKYRKQLNKQNTCVLWGIKLFRFSKEDCAFQNRIEDDIKQYFGKDTTAFVDDGLKIDRKVELYEHQTISLQEIQKRRMAGIKAFLIVLPTASGKSRIVEEDLREFAKEKPGFRGLILVPGINILADWRERVQESVPELAEKIEIRTYAYMCRHYTEFPADYYNYIVVDEAHHAVAPMLKRVIQYYEADFTVGLTATDQRPDKKKLETVFGTYSTSLSLKEAMEKGIVARANVYRIETNIDLSKVRFNGKDYINADLEKRIRVTSRNELIVNVLQEYLGDGEAARRQGVIFCVNVAHANEMAKLHIMTNEFPTSAAKKTYASCVFLENEGKDYRVSENFEKMLGNREFYEILEEVVVFGIARYQMNYSKTYQDTDLVLYQKYTYEDACRLLNWERNEVPLNIGGYKYDKKTKTFPVFINYDKQEDISDTTKYEDHFLTSDRLIAISKSGRSRDSEDVQNFLKAKERGIDVQLFVRKNKDDKISKEFYYLGRMTATGRTEEFVMANTDKTAVEIEWALDTPVREDIYEYIING